MQRAGPALAEPGPALPPAGKAGPSMPPVNLWGDPARRRLAVAAIAAIAVAGAGGCGTSSSSTPGDQGTPLTHVTVAAVTATDEIPLWLAQQDGFFRKQGLDVTVTPVTTGPLAIPDMLAGRIDVLAGGNYVSIFKGQTAGTFNMRVIAPAGSCSEDDFAILALPNSGLTKPSDLSGTTISVPTTASISTLLIGAQLSKDGLNPASVHYVDIPFLSASAALQQHRVPAITMVEPFLSAVKAAGAREVMRLCA